MVDFPLGRIFLTFSFAILLAYKVGDIFITPFVAWKLVQALKKKRTRETLLAI